jgi:hypothetical protein
MMRRAEVLKRFRAWRAEVEGTWVLNMPEAQAAEQWAAALDVEVELDETLPDAVEVDAAVDGELTVRMRRTDWLAGHGAIVAHFDRLDGREKALLVAAFNAYNAQQAAKREPGARMAAPATGDQQPFQRDEYLIRLSHKP